jgi:transposase
MKLRTRSTKYVGLDVHQATTVTSVREEGGRVIARTILPTEASAILEYFRGMRGTIHVALEEGTQAQWLHELLVPVVHRVVICNRRGSRPQGNKGDQHDADEVSDLLRCGRLRAVYHGPAGGTLRELARTYQNLVDDATRVMLRLKAVFRARGIRTPGPGVYQADQRAAWLQQLPEDRGVRFRADALYAELAVLQTLRSKAKAALVSEAQRHPAWAVLRTIPYLGPVRVALLVATLQTPWRFRTKRQLWGYAGLAVVTRTSAEYEMRAERDGPRAVRRQRRLVMTRGLNRNHNRVVKAVFKGAATAASSKAGALHDWYQGLLTRGMRAELARVTLARKLAALTLHVWKTGERYDPAQLTMPAGHAR